MLSQTQRNAVFTNIETSYTVDSISYTATKTYPAHWSGEINTPIILINYLFDADLKQSTVGNRGEWDTARLTVDVFAKTDVANGVHGIKIVREIARALVLWFKQSMNDLLYSSGVSVTKTLPAQDLSYLEEKIYRIHFEVDLLYKLF